MTEGDIVTIYEDPITKKKIEGKARLIKEQACPWPGERVWKVKFIIGEDGRPIMDDPIVTRRIPAGSEVQPGNI